MLQEEAGKKSWDGKRRKETRILGRHTNSTRARSLRNAAGCSIHNNNSAACKGDVNAEQAHRVTDTPNKHGEVEGSVPIAPEGATDGVS